MAFEAAPSTGVYVQLGGDSHLKNFGVFGSPTGRLLFDINDFDETLPGPWEFDVKRLAASAMVAAQANGLNEAQARTVTLACVRSYRERIAEYALMPMLTVWYEHIDPGALVKALPPTERVGTAQAIKKAKARHDLHVAAKMTRVVDGRPQIIDQPPLIDHGPFENFDEDVVHAMLDEYETTMLYDRRQLLKRWSLGLRARLSASAASGPMTTWCCSREAAATTSCSRPYFGASEFENHAERVVNGQRLGICRERHHARLGATTRDGTLLLLASVPRTSQLRAGDHESRSTHDLHRVLRLVAGPAHTHAPALPAALPGYLGTSIFDRSRRRLCRTLAHQMETDHQTLLERSGAVSSPAR